VVICPLIVKGRKCNRRVGKLTYESCPESHKFDGLYHRMARNLGSDFDAVRRLANRLGKRR
jgi:hypothetical protein